MLHQCKECFRKVTVADLNGTEKCPICVRSSRMGVDLTIMNTALMDSLKIIEAQKDHIKRLEERLSLLSEVSLKTSIEKDGTGCYYQSPSAE
jgi:hypothetical protein